MEALVTAVLMKCPDDPADFMMQAAGRRDFLYDPLRQWLLEQKQFDRGEFGQPVDEEELAKLRSSEREPS